MSRRPSAQLASRTGIRVTVRRWLHPSEIFRTVSRGASDPADYEYLRKLLKTVPASICRPTSNI